MLFRSLVMYNLEVAQDHTFTVGVGQWVVHNSNCWDLADQASKELQRMINQGDDVSAFAISNVTDANGNPVAATNGPPGETMIGNTPAARNLWGGCCAETHITARIIEALLNGGSIDGDQILIGMQHVGDIGPCGNCVRNLFALAGERNQVVKLGFFDGLGFNIWTFDP